MLTNSIPSGSVMSAWKAVTSLFFSKEKTRSCSLLGVRLKSAADSCITVAMYDELCTFASQLAFSVTEFASSRICPLSNLIFESSASSVLASTMNVNTAPSVPFRLCLLPEYIENFIWLSDSSPFCSDVAYSKAKFLSQRTAFFARYSSSSSFTNMSPVGRSIIPPIAEPQATSFVTFIDTVCLSPGAIEKSSIDTVTLSPYVRTATASSEIRPISRLHVCMPCVNVFIILLFLLFFD